MTTTKITDALTLIPRLGVMLLRPAVVLKLVTLRPGLGFPDGREADVMLYASSSPKTIAIRKIATTPRSAYEKIVEPLLMSSLGVSKLVRKSVTV